MASKVGQGDQNTLEWLQPRGVHTPLVNQTNGEKKLETTLTSQFKLSLGGQKGNKLEGVVVGVLNLGHGISGAGGNV
jgi:hypothetical protein